MALFRNKENTKQVQRKRMELRNNSKQSKKIKRKDLVHWIKRDMHDATEAKNNKRRR